MTKSPCFLAALRPWPAVLLLSGKDFAVPTPQNQAGNPNWPAAIQEQEKYSRLFTSAKKLDGVRGYWETAKTADGTRQGETLSNTPGIFSP